MAQIMDGKLLASKIREELKQEVEKLRLIGAKTITLGKRILRTETVGISMVSIIIYELE